MTWYLLEAVLQGNCAFTSQLLAPCYTSPTLIRKTLEFLVSPHRYISELPFYNDDLEERVLKWNDDHIGVAPPEELIKEILPRCYLARNELIELLKQTILAQIGPANAGASCGDLLDPKGPRRAHRILPDIFPPYEGEDEDEDEDYDYDYDILVPMIMTPEPEPEIMIPPIPEFTLDRNLSLITLPSPPVIEEALEELPAPMTIPETPLSLPPNGISTSSVMMAIGGATLALLLWSRFHR